MRLTSFVVWKAWASEPLRTALTVLGIAVGVAVVTAIHVVDHNTVQSQIRLKNPDFGRVDLELVPNARDREAQDVLGELGRAPSIAHAGVLRSVRVVAGTATEPPRPLGDAVVFGVGPLPDPGFRHYRVIDGRDLSGLDAEDAVLVGVEFARAHGIGPGAELLVVVPRPERVGPCLDGVRQPLRVAPAEAGTEVEPRRLRVVGLVAHENLARRNLGAVLIGSYALVSGLDPELGPGNTRFQVDVAYGADTDRVRRMLADDFVVQDDRSSMLGETADERAFRNGVKVLGGLALVLGMFVVFQTLSHGLVERLRQLGILRALGAGKRAVTAIFLVDALALGILGSLLGVVGGLVLAFVMGVLKLTTLGVGKEITTFEIPMGPVLWTVALGIGFTAAGAVFPLWKARNLPVQRILGGHGLGDGEEGSYVLRGVDKFLFALLVFVLPVVYLAMTPLLASEGASETRFVLVQLYALALVFGALLLLAPSVVRALAAPLLFVLRFFRRWRLPAFLVGRALQRDTGRFAASMCGLAVVLVAWIALQSITAALHADIDRFYDDAMAGRVYVRTRAGTTAEDLASLQRLPNVASATPVTGPVDVGFQLVGIPVEALADGGAFDAIDTEAVASFVRDRSLVVSRRLAHLRALDVGDEVILGTDGGKVIYRVAAISDAVGFFPDERAFAATLPAWLERDFCRPADHGVTQCIVRADGPGRGGEWSVRDAIGSVREDLVMKKAGFEIADYLRRDTDRDFVVFHVLLALILGLAGIGLVNQMTLAALGRAREIGVLRALSVDRRQLRRMFVVEAAVVSGGATLIAWGLGPALGYLVVQGLNRVAGLDAPFAAPWVMLAITPVLAFGLGAVAAWLPGSRALRVEPAAAVRYA
jgi:putative ABC transport system permease protein